MERFIFLLAVLFAVLAIVSRHHLNKNTEDSNAGQSVEENLTASGDNPASLSYAMQKISDPQKNNPPQAPVAQAPPPAKDVTKDLDKLIQAIQMSNEESAEAFQKALTLTSSPDQLALKLTVLQAAMSIQGENLSVRNIAIREATSILVPANLSSENPPPEEMAQRDLQRNIVTTAYKVYLQTAQDSDSVYNDTVQVMNYQADPWVRRQISFEAINRFPQLRERLNEQQQ